MDSELKERKEKILKYLEDKKNYVIYLVLAALAYLAFWIRTRNLGILNGQLADPDAHLFYRYAEYILEHGKLFAVDPLRYYPLGYETAGENVFVSYFIVYLYKFLHFFMPSLTLKQVDIMYPALVFIPALIFFYLLVKKLFDWRVGLLASGILVIIPGFLFRTMSGVSDKEGLAILFLFMTLYFFVAAWQEKTLKRAVIYSVLTALSTMFLGASWGGVQFVFLIFALSNLVAIFLDKFDKKDFVVYGIWYILSVLLLIIFVPGRFFLNTFIVSPVIASTTFVFFLSIVDFLYKKNFLKLKDKLKINASHGIISFVISLVIGFIIILILQGPSFFVSVYNDIITNLLAPFGTNRWALTVAESRQPYFVDWIGDFGKLYFALFMVASVFLFYEFIKPIKKWKWSLIGVYTFFIFSLVFSRYSPSSRLNGSSNLSLFLYFGSSILFIGSLVYVYLYTYYKDKDTYSELLSTDKKYIFIIIWLAIMLIATRGAIRLVFVLVPVTTLLVGHLLFYVYDLFKLDKYKKYKIIAIILIIIVLLFMLIPFYKKTITQAKYIGPMYNEQWQNAEKWVKENTNEDDVFVHWWDYGYLVQTGFNRATVTDGGNAMGSWNHFVGRYVLTAQNETEALEFMKAHEVDYLLIVSEDIGKYTAFSSIGSGVIYDRFSWIVVSHLDPNNIQQTRDGFIYFYSASIALDEDIIYNGKIFPARLSGIGGFFIPAKVNNNEVELGQPIAVFIYNNERTDLKLRCLYYNYKLYEFNDYDIDACIRIVPAFISEENVNNIASLIYISPRVKRSLFGKIYLLNQETENIKLVYSDYNAGRPLIVYNGRLFGPLKIWKITYPNYIKTKLEYLSLDIPDERILIPDKSLYN